MNLEPLLTAIKEDYNRWSGRSPYGDEQRKAEREIEFAAGVSVQEGRKYIKIIQGGSVWGFIMKADDQKFRAGDILMAAGWAAPARNKARGNVIDGDLSWVRWTGPEYL